MPSGRHFADRREQAFRIAILADITIRSRLQCPLDHDRLVVHAVHQNGQVRVVRADATDEVFTADAGPAIVVAMSDQRERFRLVANVVDNVPLPAPMPNLPVGHAVWKPRPDFRTSATCWLMSGAAHHTVMSNQIGLDVIREFARLSRIELLVIDESTSVVSFEYGLRANAAYYRLSQGL